MNTFDKLAALVDIINAGHKKAVGSVRRTLDHAIEIGSHLAEARELVKASGNSWMKWRKANCQFSNDTAEVYLLVFRHREAVAEATSIADAIKIIRAAKRSERPAKISMKTQPDDRLSILMAEHGVRAKREAILSFLQAFGVEYREVSQAA